MNVVRVGEETIASFYKNLRKCASTSFLRFVLNQRTSDFLLDKFRLNFNVKLTVESDKDRFFIISRVHKDIVAV